MKKNPDGYEKPSIDSLSMKVGQWKSRRLRFSQFWK